MITDNRNGTYDITFGNGDIVRGVRITEGEMAYYKNRRYPKDGLLLMVFEKAFGSRGGNQYPFEVIDKGCVWGNWAAKILTGNTYEDDYLFLNTWLPISPRQMAQFVDNTLTVGSDPQNPSIVTFASSDHFFALARYQRAQLNPLGGSTVTIQDPNDHNPLIIKNPFQVMRDFVAILHLKL